VGGAELPVQGEHGLFAPRRSFSAFLRKLGQSFPDLWGLFQIEAPAAWEVTQGEGVVVAVVDSGLDVDHPDIAQNVWENEGEIPDNAIDDDGNGFVDDATGWDFTRCVETDVFRGTCPKPKEPGADLSDPVGHGTHLAGLIAAVPSNGIGMIGVAPRAKIMVVKGLDRSGSGRNEDLAEALVYAAENGARIINASWSGPPSRTIEAAIEYVISAFDVVVVASADNGGVPLERGVYPANLSNVLAVGATTETDERAPFSNFGGPLDLTAPLRGLQLFPLSIPVVQFGPIVTGCDGSAPGSVSLIRPLIVCAEATAGALSADWFHPAGEDRFLHRGAISLRDINSLRALEDLQSRCRKSRQEHSRHATNRQNPSSRPAHGITPCSTRVRPLLLLAGCCRQKKALQEIELNRMVISTIFTRCSWGRGPIEALLRSVAFVAPWREAFQDREVLREVTEKKKFTPRRHERHERESPLELSSEALRRRAAR
jgi:hypothetical protein